MILKRLLGRFAGQSSKTITSPAGNVPIIGTSPVTSSASFTSGPAPAELQTIGTSEGAASGTAPNQPIIGTRRGHSYAAHFADRLVAWMRSEGLRLHWQSDQLVWLAAHVFAPTAGMEMPIIRNLQTALKRRNDVKVCQNVRIYDERGNYIGKRTLYVIQSASLNRTDIEGAGSTSLNSVAP